MKNKKLEEILGQAMAITTIGFFIVVIAVVALKILGWLISL